MDWHQYMLSQNTPQQSLMVIMGVPTMINCFNFESGTATLTLIIVMYSQNTMNNK